MNDTFIKALTDKEQELLLQLEGLRSTITLFQNGKSADSQNLVVENANLNIPQEFDNGLTWNKKIIFILSKINEGFVSDIVKELKKQGAKEDDKFLTKRIGVMTSFMKKKNILGAKSYGKKAKYFIK